MSKTAKIVEESKQKAQALSSASPKRKRGTHPNSLKNLKPYPKGVSGNPGGQPKDDISREIARAIFSQNKEAIYKALGKAVLAGNAYTFDVLAKRAYGDISKIELKVDDSVISLLQRRRNRLAKEKSA